MRWVTTSVGRLHREREARKRRRRRGQPSVQAEERVQAMMNPPGRSPLPISAASLLGLDQGGDAAVLDGQLLQVLWRAPRKGEEVLQVNRCPQAVRMAGRLDRHLQMAVLRPWQEVCRWARWQQMRQGLSFPPLAAGTAEQVGQFVEEKLIPRLRAEAGSAAPPRRVPASSDSAAAVPQVQLLSRLAHQALVELPRAWPRAFAFYGQQWYALVAFHGPPQPGQFHLRWRDQEYVEGNRLSRRQALEQQEQWLREAILRLFEPLQPKFPQAQVLYQDETYAVLRTSPQHYFCCRQIPAYVVEGEDRVLYLFEKVEIGVWLQDVEVKKVVHSLAAMLMHPYQHMFLFGGGAGAPICMPRPDEYYEKLRRLPLEEAVLQHLESARMTLCSGYYAGNVTARYHDIRRLGKRRITLEQAQAQGLPVYWYYRDQSERR